MNEKSKKINEQIHYGLDQTNPNDIIQIKLKDFMLIYKTMKELNAFFHQPDHFKNLEELETFLGNREYGAYSLINKIYYQILDQYLPEDIINQFEKEDNQLYNHQLPECINEAIEKGEAINYTEIRKKHDQFLIELRMGSGLNKVLLEDILQFLNSSAQLFKKKNQIPKEWMEIFIDTVPIVYSQAGSSLYSKDEQEQIFKAGDAILEKLYDCVL